MVAKPAQERREIQTVLRTRHGRHAGAAGTQAVDASRVRVTGHEDHRALRVLGVQHLRADRGARLGVDDDAKGIAAAHFAHRERGIVGEHGADAYEDRVVPVSQAMDLPERGLSREIAASLHRDASVHGGRELHQYEWTSARDARDESLVQPLRVVLEYPRRDLDVGCAE